MNYLLFGGAGYVGKAFQAFTKADSKCFSTDRQDSGDHFCDVRLPISTCLCPFQPDWIILLAAVHREPGHLPQEYFETNIKGAINVARYASEIGCKNIFFMSSISPYGPTPGPTDETALPQPNSPYGISKLAAELILQGWQKESADRRLIVCRPGVIFGPNDPGNIGRTIQAVRKGYFFYPGNRKVRKSYAYIQGLLDSMLFTIKRDEAFILYNYVEKETETLEHLCRCMAQLLNCRPPLASFPLQFLRFAAVVAQWISKGRSELHPIRVQKAAMPTHIIPQWLIEKGFLFRWPMITALKITIAETHEYPESNILR